MDAAGTSFNALQALSDALCKVLVPQPRHWIGIRPTFIQFCRPAPEAVHSDAISFKLCGEHLAALPLA